VANATAGDSGLQRPGHPFTSPAPTPPPSSKTSAILTNPARQIILEILSSCQKTSRRHRIAHASAQIRVIRS